MTTLVTSLNRNLWQKYAHKTVPRLLEKVDTDRKLVFHEDDLGRVCTSDLAEQRKIEDPEFYEFIKRNRGKDTPKLWGKAVRFAPKAFSIIEAAEIAGGEWLIWLDADVYAKRSVGATQWMNWLTGGDIIHLSRPESMGYSETGFIAFNLDCSGVWDLLDDFRSMYVEDTIYNERQFHDAWLLSRLIERYERDGRLSSRSLTLRNECHVFPQSELKDHLDHWKGPSKLEK